MLPHENLDAFWLAEEYVAFLDYLLPRIKAASKADGDQLDRNGGSVLLNLMEAAADRSAGDKVRFFRYARREVNESYGVFVRITARRRSPMMNAASRITTQTG